ncbi:TPA: hypothetical protein OXM11_003689, partial [Acinetobacter baumannii]|nr:hypothetical protein [Acinetobacter baumannii]
AVVESYSNGMGCAILTKAMAIEAKLGDKILNQMDDTSSYLLIYDCRAYYNIAFQQTVSIHIGKC